MKHPIDVVEAAYDLAASTDAWLDGLVRAVGQDAEVGGGVYAFVCALEPKIKPLTKIASRGVPQGLLKLVGALNAVTPPKVAARMRGSAVTIGSMVAEMGGPNNFVALTVRTFLNPIVDCLSMFVQDGEGHLLQVVAPATELVDVHARTAESWRRVLFHVGTGLRLRRRLAASPEALVAPGGKVVHAEGAAREPSARDALAAAVRRVERARGAERARDPEAALRMWHGLVEGRWSLVDQWEGDGRRYIAARENLPRIKDPRALGQTEQAYLSMFLRGTTPAEIAFAFGRAEATVTHALSVVASRLGLPNRVALSRLGEEECLERLAVSLGGDQLDVLVVHQPSVHPAWELILSEAELEVALALCLGRSAKESAEDRGVSPRTIENQIASVYLKTGATRTTLAQTLASAPEAHSAGGAIEEA